MGASAIGGKPKIGFVRFPKFGKTDSRRDTDQDGLGHLHEQRETSRQASCTINRNIVFGIGSITFVFSRRCTELSRWREILEKLLERLASEIGLLRDERTDAERELESLNQPLQVTAQCISMRDCRRGTELTYDEADNELKKELCVTESVKKLLTNR